MFDTQSASKSHPFDEILGRLSISYSNDYIHRNGSDIGIPVLFPTFCGCFEMKTLYQNWICLHLESCVK